MRVIVGEAANASTRTRMSAAPSSSQIVSSPKPCDRICQQACDATTWYPIRPEPAAVDAPLTETQATAKAEQMIALADVVGVDLGELEQVRRRVALHE